MKIKLGDKLPKSELFYIEKDNFVKKVNPGGPGWSKYTLNESKEIWQLPRGILLMFLGCSAVYSVLLGVGQLIYGNKLGYFLILLSIISGFGLKKFWK